MSLVSSLSSHLRLVSGVPEPAAGTGRAAIVAHVDRWLSGPGRLGERAALVVIDVELDDAIPDGADAGRRRRLSRCVERTLSSCVRPGDIVARVDGGRFALLRPELPGDRGAAEEATALARAVECALVSRPEGQGARVTAGGLNLPRVTAGALNLPGGVGGGTEALVTVKTAMLRAKLFSDDRVVVVVATRP